MSRNLLRTDCHRCQGAVTLTGPAHPITREEGGVYIDEYKGMIVADATCSVCGALYLAWVNGRPDWMLGHLAPRNRPSDAPFVDLSYRSTFNDEPGAGDLPPWSPPPAPRFGPANVGKLFYWFAPHATEATPFRLCSGGERVLFFMDDFGGGYRFDADDANRNVHLAPDGWKVVGGRLMRPVTAEELPA